MLKKLNVTAPPLVKGLEEATFDGLVKYIKSGHATNTVFLTGAGTSVASGIPDFRTPKIGLYANLDKYKLPYPEAVFDIEFFDTNPGPFFDVCRNILPGTFKPSPAHYLPVLFDKHKLLTRLYTQNIDSLDISAGLPLDKIVEAHGSFTYLTCRKCGSKFEFADYKEEFQTGKVVHCRECKEGVIKPDVVFYGEDLPQRFHHLSENDFSTANLLIIMGTSLTVSPCCMLPGYCPPNCVRVLINNEPAGKCPEAIKVDKNGVGHNKYEKEEPHLLTYNCETNTRDIFLKGDLQEICEKLINALGWNNEYLKLKK
ncbi:transcriptional regulator, Sir2 family protein [Trichomonas vaginalis G3]|uniref:Transcriptional regulator, Sir2 family protein n=1 Tax=Trichomonas vaginalis (strain ATCC PRA-98 / G3) TaxID=412133 RepID=A2GAR7_TRIV3|nr:NAD+ binding [Trichomonas vaginalis G3]EAX85753.1 transcriptional regulator, Sir2 family protein [Trichomonas vaginalis G3]KAI5513974.1 NAD+ binding [Trichomonas vaginalis G3]|eukprot:XP_001298683.1 transcriptional regulator, Sir2 family protein [Trichomonas vaginalis G3]